MLDLDAALNVGIGVQGAKVATDSINMVAGAFQNAVRTAADVELLKKSLGSLSAVELVNRGQFDTINDAMSTATLHAEALYAAQARAAAHSPFSLDDISGAAKTAAAYGFLATQIQDVARARELEVITAQRLSQVALDTVAGTGQSGYVVNEIVGIIGKATATGKYLQEDINMLVDRQVMVADILSRAWDMPVSKVKEMQTAGKLTADVVNAELIPALESMYGGKAAEAGDTISGQLSSFADALMFRQQDLFAPAIGVLKDELTEINEYLFAENTIEAAREAGEVIEGVTRHAVDAAGVVVDVSSTVSGLLKPALVAAGTAGAIAGTQWLVAGGAATILSVGLSNVASTAWAAQAALRGMTITSVSLAAIPATIGGLVYINQELTRTTNEASDALYEHTKGYRLFSQATEVYNALGPETKQSFEETYNALVKLNEEHERALKQDTNNAVRTVPDWLWWVEYTDIYVDNIQTVSEASAIATQNANYRSDVMEQAAIALYNDADASRSAADAALLKAVADGKSAEEAQRRLKALEDAAKTRDSLIDEEVSFQKELFDLEAEAAQKRLEARDTYIDAQSAAQKRYDDAELAAAEAHEQRLHDIRVATYTSLLDSALEYSKSLLGNEEEQQDELNTLRDDVAQAKLDAEKDLREELADINADYNQKELDEIASYNDEVSDLRDEWNEKLLDSMDTARTDALSALDTLAGTDVDFLRDSEQRLEDWNAKRELLYRQGATCKLDEERAAFEDAEAEAARHYLEQEQQQRESLGRQLIDFTVAQALKQDVSAEALSTMLTGISEATGLYDTASAELLGNTFAGIQQWAQSGGQGASAVLANIQALPGAAAQARLEQERLTDAMVDQAVSVYAASGDVLAYQQSLQQIPTNVAVQMGLSVEDYQSNDLLIAHQTFLNDVETAHSEHNDAMNDLNDQREKDAAQAQQSMLDGLDTEEEIQKKRQDILDKYTDKAEDLKLDYAQKIGQTLFEKGLSQQEVNEFLQNEMPGALAEVERINQTLQDNLTAGMSPEMASVQWAYAMDASEYASLTGKAGGASLDSLMTKIDEVNAANSTMVTELDAAWDTYQTTLTEEIPQWYEDSKTQILATHADKVAELINQMDELTSAEQRAMYDMAVIEGRYLARRSQSVQDEITALVQSGVEGESFYRQYNKLLTDNAETLDMSLSRRERGTTSIVTGEGAPALYTGTPAVRAVFEKVIFQVGNEQFVGFIKEQSRAALEEDYEASQRNGGLRWE